MENKAIYSAQTTQPSGEKETQVLLEQTSLTKLTTKLPVA